jgi:hypothetical protein
MLALEQSVIELKSQMANMESQRADLALQLLRLRWPVLWQQQGR